MDFRSLCMMNLAVADAQHLPYLEKPDLVNKEVFQFLHQ